MVQRPIEEAAEKMRDNVNKELKKFDKLGMRERIAIGVKLAQNSALLRYFYSLTDVEREEWVKLELMDMGIDPWD